MDPIQSAFHAEADTLAGRATRLVLGLLVRGLSGLLREVRDLRARVRVWLTQLARALPALTPLQPRQKSQSRTATPRAAKGYRRSARFGLTLVVSPRRPPTVAPAQSDTPKAKPRKKHDPVATLAELVFALQDLQRTIADPRAAAAHIARRLRATAAAPTSGRSEPAYRPPADDIQSTFRAEPASVTSAAPRPDTS